MNIAMHMALLNIVKGMNNYELASIYKHFIENNKLNGNICTPDKIKNIIPSKFSFKNVVDYITEYFYEIDGILHKDIENKMKKAFIRWCLMNSSLPQDWLEKNVLANETVTEDWSFLLNDLETNYLLE